MIEIEFLQKEEAKNYPTIIIIIRTTLTLITSVIKFVI